MTGDQMFEREVGAKISAVALALFGLAGNASADEAKFGYSLSITGSSDYIFRGISYTSQAPTINVYNEFTYGIAYLGLWTSTINYGTLGPYEQDIYLGLRPVTGPISWDLAAQYYIYGNRDHGQFGSVFDTSYLEFKVGATASPVKNLMVGTNVFLIPDQGYAATNNLSLEGAVSYDLPQIGEFSPSVSGLIGWSHSGTNKYYPTGYWEGLQQYTYWNAGLKLTVDKYFMDFRYWGTSIDHNDIASDRFVFSAGVNLLP
ncbi:MAG: TorF family putative porin [Hyphomicrobium sp.]|nr:TorF family putative porin [Hyphomicrobium sp.]